MWLRSSEKNIIGYCPEPLVKYRMHAGGLSKKYRFMSEMRIQVITDALSSSRGGTLTSANKRKIYASTWATSGWDAARGKDLRHTLKYFFISICYWPFSYSTWYDMVRCLAGRA